MCYILWYNAPTMLPAGGRQHPHFAVWSRNRSRTPMIHLLLLFYAKNLVQFRDFPANPDKFPNGTFFGTNFAQIFRMCKCSVRIL